MKIKKFIITISKWLLRTITVLLLLIVATLFFFSWQTSKREIKSGIETAPSTGRFIQAADIQIFIQEMGSANGVPVLLVHGTGAWGEIWRETMITLAENGFRAIAIDVPPIGFSEKPKGADAYSREKQAERILGVLDSLNINQVNLVAHSVGARPAIEATLIAQDRVKNFVLVDPALGFTS